MALVWIVLAIIVALGGFGIAGNIAAGRQQSAVRRMRLSGVVTYLAIRSRDLARLSAAFPAPGRVPKLPSWFLIETNAAGFQFATVGLKAVAQIPWSVITGLRVVQCDGGAGPLRRGTDIEATITIDGQPQQFKLNLSGSVWGGPGVVTRQHPELYLPDERSLQIALEEIESQRPTI